jgi:HlyD family secretion protein
MEIVDYNDLQVNVKVDEYDISAVKVGKTATVNIGAINKDIKGKISSMSNEGLVVNGVTYFIATIDLAKDKDVKIGMSAEVKLLSAKATGVVTLPMTAIQFDENNKPYVFVQSGKGKPIQTEITTGINDGTTVEVKSGVTGGETILYTKPAATTNGIGFKGPRRINSSGGGNNDGNS